MAWSAWTLFVWCLSGPVHDGLSLFRQGPRPWTPTTSNKVKREAHGAGRRPHERAAGRHPQQQHTTEAHPPSAPTHAVSRTSFSHAHSIRIGQHARQGIKVRGLRCVTSTLHEVGVSLSNRGHYVPALAATAVGGMSGLAWHAHEQEYGPVSRYSLRSHSGHTLHTRSTRLQCCMRSGLRGRTVLLSRMAAGPAPPDAFLWSAIVLAWHCGMSMT